MNESRLPDYLKHMQSAAADACNFVKGLSKEEFCADKRTQQAVIMSLIIIGEAATKIMARSWIDTLNSQSRTQKFRGAVCAGCATGSPTATSTSISM